jgi:hypothetical protein
MFAVRLVPDGNDLDARFESLNAGLQLGLRLMRKAISGAY